MQKIKKKIGFIYEKILINIKWIIFKFFTFKPIVMSKEDTIEYILKKNLSISRFGDGEFRLMCERGEIGFQKMNPKLAKDLRQCFAYRDNRLLICSYDFREKRKMKTKSGRWLKLFTFRYYSSFKRFFDKKYKYGNTDITRFYHPDFKAYTDFNYLKNKYIPLLKRLWEDRNIIIVEGKETKLGIGNDLFESASKTKRIVCPPVDAYDYYESIYKAILKNYDTGDLVLLALGPTASVLAANLTIQEGIQCIDIGHVDIVYLWYLHKSSNVDCILGKYVNEKRPDSGLIDISYDMKEYEAQIVERIG